MFITAGLIAAAFIITVAVALLLAFANPLASALWPKPPSWPADKPIRLTGAGRFAGLHHG